MKRGATKRKARECWVTMHRSQRGKEGVWEMCRCTASYILPTKHERLLMREVAKPTRRKHA